MAEWAIPETIDYSICKEGKLNIFTLHPFVIESPHLTSNDIRIYINESKTSRFHPSHTLLPMSYRLYGNKLICKPNSHRTNRTITSWANGINLVIRKLVGRCEADLHTCHISLNRVPAIVWNGQEMANLYSRLLPHPSLFTCGYISMDDENKYEDVTDRDYVPSNETESIDSEVPDTARLPSPIISGSYSQPPT